MLWEELNDIIVKALKESVMNPPALEHPTDQIPFPLFFLIWKGRKRPRGAHPEKQRHHWSIVQNCQQLDPVAQGYEPCLRATEATALPVKATEKTIVGSPVSFLLLMQKDLSWIFITSTFSSQPSHCLPLTAPHIILWHFNALNLAALLLSSTDRLAMIAQCWQTTSWHLMVNYRIFHWVIRTLTSPGSLTVLTEKATIASTVLEMLLDLFSMLLSSVFIYGYFGPTD